MTARTPTEDEPRGAAEWFRAPFGATTVGLVEADPDARILRANAAFCHMTGYAPAELGAMTLADLLFPEDRDRVLAQYGAITTGQARSYEADRRYRRKDGSALWARVSAAAQAPGVVPTGVCAVVIDLSDRKHLEEQIWHAQKVETAGLLATCLAHDLNNLLTIVNGAAQLLLDELPETGPTGELVRGMAAACQRAAGLTTQLLAFSRKQPAAPRVFDLNEVVAQSTRLLRYLLGDGIALVPDLAANPAQVRADPAQVEQIVLNLAVNAKDAMPHGGRLTIATRAVRLGEPDRTGDDLPPGAYVLLRVSDTGTGMTDEVKARAFEPFFTTKQAGKGTGLGLAAVHGAVKRCGGQVGVTSAPGAGTTITILLPTATAVPA
jgi:PAS domain S-box-containing protein